MQALTSEEKQTFIIARSNLKQVIEDTPAAAMKEKPGNNPGMKIEGVFVED